MISAALFIFGSACLGAAIFFQVRRNRRLIEQYLAESAAFASLPSAFDGRVAQRVEAVRQNYLAELAARESDQSFREELLASATEAVKRCAYFRSKNVPLNDAVA